MKKYTRIIPLLSVFAATAVGCGVPEDEDLDSSEEIVSTEQAVRICAMTDCGGREPRQAVREMGLELGLEMFEGQEDVDKEKAGTYMLSLILDAQRLAQKVPNPFADQPVTVEEAKKICKDRNGRFADKVLVQRFIDGEQAVLPLGPAFNLDKPQKQRAKKDTIHAGTGHPYNNQCVHTDPDGKFYFDDGPSIPPNLESKLPPRVTSDDKRYKILFWEAGRQHDYCYHHTPMYSAGKFECDDNFDRTMHQICDQKYRGLFGLRGTSLNRASCKLAAKAMTAAVRYFGAEAYNYTKTYVRYLEKPEPHKPVYPDNQGPLAEVPDDCQSPMQRSQEGTCSCNHDAARSACTSNNGDGRAMEYVIFDHNTLACGSCEVAQ